jgi:hypothetical protein
MKKLVSLLLALCLLTTTALADVIWAPWGDDAATKFFETHDTTYVGRQYRCDGYGGQVCTYASPNDLTVVETLENGQTLWVQYIWADDDLTWGLYYRDRDGGELVAWVPMDDLALVYDSTAFCEDHEIADYDGSYDDVTAGYLWTYPGSGVCGDTPLEVVPAYSETFNFSKLYTDSSGNVWCYISYYMADRGWICVTDPLNPDLPVVEVDQPASVAQQLGRPTVSPQETTNAEPVIALVIALVAVTGVLIAVFWKRKPTGKA